MYRVRAACVNFSSLWFQLCLCCVAFVLYCTCSRSRFSFCTFHCVCECSFILLHISRYTYGDGVLYKETISLSFFVCLFFKRLDYNVRFLLIVIICWLRRLRHNRHSKTCNLWLYSLLFGRLLLVSNIFTL